MQVLITLVRCFGHVLSMLRNPSCRNEIVLQSLIIALMHYGLIITAGVLIDTTAVCDMDRNT